MKIVAAVYEPELGKISVVVYSAINLGFYRNLDRNYKRCKKSRLIWSLLIVDTFIMEIPIPNESTVN